MKANPNREVLRCLDKSGIKIDASSGFEAERAIKAGIKPEDILITTQELPKNLKDLVGQGVLFNASSAHQLEQYGQNFPGSEAGIRINTGLSDGINNRLSTGGPNASFGIWHEYIGQAQAIADKYNLKIVRVINHIGTGRDPDMWKAVVERGLEVIAKLPDVTEFDIGGGFKIAYMQDELDANLDRIAESVSEALVDFEKTTGRKLKLEIEPGRFIAANAGALISRVEDIVDTGEQGHEFIKLDTGMSEILRPVMYGAQHPIIIVNNQTKHQKYIVAGHSCETGDTLTTQEADPESFAERLLSKASIGDLAVIEGTGAYCAAMSAVNYNSFPQAAEVMVLSDGSYQLVRRRQTMDEMLALEN
jgi:diaminopimelate decarboxylase